jgi:hypothetical protein
VKKNATPRGLYWTASLVLGECILGFLACCLDNWQFVSIGFSLLLTFIFFILLGKHTVEPLSKQLPYQLLQKPYHIRFESGKRSGLKPLVFAVFAVMALCIVFPSLAAATNNHKIGNTASSDGSPKGHDAIAFSRTLSMGRDGYSPDQTVTAPIISCTYPVLPSAGTGITNM